MARTLSIHSPQSMEADSCARLEKIERPERTVVTIDQGPPSMVRTRSGTMLHKLTTPNREPGERPEVSSTRGDPLERPNMKRMRKVLSWNALPLVARPGLTSAAGMGKGKPVAQHPGHLAAQWIWRGSKYSGMLCLVSGALLYSLMRLLVKLLSLKSVPSFETIMFRSLVIASPALACCVRRGDNPFGRRGVRHLLVARALIGFLSISCFFYSIERLPLRDAAMLNFTLPVFTAFFGRVFLGEPWHLREAFGSLVSILGVILITHPPSFFPAEVLVDVAAGGLKKQTATNDPLGVAVALLGAVAGAGAYILLRKVGKLAEPPMVVVFVFAALSLPLSAMGMLLFQEFVVPSRMQVLALVGVGLAAFGAQVLVTRGLQMEKASRAASMQYVTALATYTMGVAFLGEIPTSSGILGATLVALSASFVAIKAS